jgi:hypothetical protein
LRMKDYEKILDNLNNMVDKYCHENEIYYSITAYPPTEVEKRFCMAGNQSDGKMLDAIMRQFVSIVCLHYKAGTLTKSYVNDIFVGVGLQMERYFNEATRDEEK